jgi:hypothetical protein
MRPGFVEVERDKLVLLEKIRRYALSLTMATVNDPEQQRARKELEEMLTEYYITYQKGK